MAKRKQEKEKPKKRDRTGKTIRVLGTEICGIEAVEGADPESSSTLKSAKISIRAMGMCLARAMRVCFEFQNRQATDWAGLLPDGLKGKLGLVEKQEEREVLDKKTGKMVTRTVTIRKFEGDDVAVKTAIRQILQWMCPCLPSATLDQLTGISVGDFAAWNKRRFENPEEQQSLIVYQPPYPLSFRARQVKVGRTGDRQMILTVPLRTGELCKYAQENPKKARCVCAEVKVKGNGSDKESTEQIVPLRGIPGKGPVKVSFRCFVAGKKKRKAYEAFENILAGTWEHRDLRIALQGSKFRKQSWMARLTYERPLPPRVEGGDAAAVFSFTHLVYGVTDDGRTYHRAYGEGMRRKNNQFEAMARRQAYKQLRSMAHQVGSRWDRKAGAQKLVMAGQKHFRELGDDLRKASFVRKMVDPKGGKERQFRDVRAVQGKQKRWTDHILRQVAIDFVRWLKDAGIGRLFLLKWHLRTNGELPGHVRHAVLEFPRYRLAQILVQLCEEQGIEPVLVDLEKGGKADLPVCPCCQSPLERVERDRGELCKCTAIQPDGEPCQFQVYYNEWRALNVLARSGADVERRMRELISLRETIRKMNKTNKDAETESALEALRKKGGAKEVTDHA